MGLHRRCRFAAAFGMIAYALVAAPVLAQGRPAGVTVEAVLPRMMSETVPVFAEVVTARDGVIASRVPGTVAEVHVLPGSAVESGDPLATLDTELTEIELRQAEARVAEARAGIATAEARRNRFVASLERIDRLRDTAAFSQGRFEEAEGEALTAEGQLAEAEARVTTAETALAEVRYRIEQAEIRAPFPGTVLETLTNPGEYIGSGAPVARLLDTRALEIEASVPSVYASGLTVGARIVGRTDDGAGLDLVVRAVLPVEDRGTRTLPVRFTAADPGALRSKAVGASATVDIPTGPSRNVLAVPKDALVQGTGGWTVFVASEGVAQPRTVGIGEATDGWFEVTSGLAEGDLVVVRGNERLRPGQPITPQTADGAGQ